MRERKRRSYEAEKDDIGRGRGVGKRMKESRRKERRGDKRE